MELLGWAICERHRDGVDTPVNELAVPRPVMRALGNECEKTSKHMESIAVIIAKNEVSTQQGGSDVELLGWAMVRPRVEEERGKGGGAQGSGERNTIVAPAIDRSPHGGCLREFIHSSDVRS